jgi:8-oxo-dGTP diphosphatase
VNDDTFLESYDADRYPHPSLSVDVALLTVHEGRVHALLLPRERPPQRGRWALPGGFVGIDEGLDRAAARVLHDRVGLDGVFLEQLYTFGEPRRDPRTRVVTVAYYALIAPERLGDLPLAPLTVPWEGEAGGIVTPLGPDGASLATAFDHDVILGTAVQRIRGKLDYAPIGFQLLPERFTLRRLQQVHETVLGRSLNKDAFRRRMLASGQLDATGRRETGTPFRPAELYRFRAGSAI